MEKDKIVLMPRWNEKKEWSLSRWFVVVVVVVKAGSEGDGAAAFIASSKDSRVIFGMSQSHLHSHD